MTAIKAESQEKTTSCKRGYFENNVLVRESIDEDVNGEENTSMVIDTIPTPGVKAKK